MEKKTNKKTLGIIIAIIVILLIIAIVGGIFVFKNANSFETEWGEFYYQTLERESKKYEGYTKNENGELETNEFDYYADTNNVAIQFIQIEDDSIPIMAVSYEKNNYKQLNIYEAKESENETYKYTYVLSQYPTITAGQEQKSDGNYDVQLLYNIEEQRYIWYIHRIDTENRESFTPMVSNEKSYSFTEEEMKTNQVAEDGTPIISKFEETFIPIDNVDSSIEIGDIHNIDEKDLKNNIKLAEEQYKDANTFVTEEIKTATQNKVAEIENKKEQIKVAEEEKAKKEEEEKAKAEEAARIAAEEEAKKGLKVGNYTIKYGTYRDPEFGTIFILKQDGTCVYGDKNYTYKVEKYDFSQYEVPNYKTGIVFYQSNGEKYFAFYPYNNTTLYSCGIESLVYIGN